MGGKCSSWEACASICCAEGTGQSCSSTNGTCHAHDGKGTSVGGTTTTTKVVEECSGDKCTGYRGIQTITMSGYTCMAWASQNPHKHTYSAKKYPDGDMTENFCRNPSDHTGIWCYTTNPDKRWDNCEPVKEVEEETDEPAPEECSGDKCNGYRGIQTTTRSGFTC